MTHRNDPLYYAPIESSLEQDIAEYIALYRNDASELMAAVAEHATDQQSRIGQILMSLAFDTSINPRADRAELDAMIKHCAEHEAAAFIARQQREAA